MRAPTLALLALTLIACGDRPQQTVPTTVDPAPGHQTTDEAGQQDLKDAARQVWAGSSDLLAEVSTSAARLDQAVQALLQSPDNTTLAAARQAWQQCHLQWLALSYQLALIDAHQGLFDDLAQLTSAIGGWPIQPGFLDYFDVYSQSGLVNDIAIAINAQSIRSAHQQFDTDDRALGLHAIAYLLWGENGQRPADDFRLATTEARAEEAPKADELPSNRRRALLALQVNLLADDLQTLALQWQPNSRAQLNFNRQSGRQASELLRSSSIYLIEQQLINQQLQPSIEPDATHGRFAGTGNEAWVAQLNSLTQLTGDQARPLIEDWTGGDASAWIEQLQAAERSLAKLTEEVNNTQTVAAIASLQQLAQLIKLPETEPE